MMHTCIERRRQSCAVPGCPAVIALDEGLTSTRAVAASLRQALADHDALADSWEALGNDDMAGAHRHARRIVLRALAAEERLA